MAYPTANGELFSKDRTDIGRHIRNIYKEGELEKDITCAKFAHMGTEGDQQYEYTAYNLDVIISVGYRVKSQRGTRFRQWANKVLKEYLLRGYAVNSRIVALEQHAAKHDVEIHELQNKVDFFVRTSLPPVEGIFFDGQIFDVYTFVSDLIRSAKKSIVLFDNYVDDTVLTMLDKLLKGREFEDYVLELIDVQNNAKLALKEWRSDKSMPGIYPESNSGPDFVFEYDSKSFAVECKWRSHMPKDIEKELLPAERMEFFGRFSLDRHMPVYFLLGIGGLPNNPDCLYFSPLGNTLIIETLHNSLPLTKESLLVKIESLFSHTEHPNYIEQQKTLYPNAYKPWHTDDDALLTRLYSEGASVKDLMVAFQRNHGSIASRLRKLGLTQ